MARIDGNQAVNGSKSIVPSPLPTPTIHPWNTQPLLLARDQAPVPGSGQDPGKTLGQLPGQLPGQTSGQAKNQLNSKEHRKQTDATDGAASVQAAIAAHPEGVTPPGDSASNPWQPIADPTIGRPHTIVTVELDNGKQLSTVLQRRDAANTGSTEYLALIVVKTADSPSGRIQLAVDLEAHLPLDDANSLGQAKHMASEALRSGALRIHDSALPIYDPAEYRHNALQAGAIGVGTDASRPGAMPVHHEQVLNTRGVVVSGGTEFNFRAFDPQHRIRDELNHPVRDALQFRLDNGLDAPRTLAGAALLNTLGAEMGLPPNAGTEALLDQQAANYSGWPLDMVQTAARGITAAGGPKPTFETLDIFAELNGEIMRSPLFKVHMPEEPGGFRLVDSQGNTYRDIAHFRSRNNLPAGALFTPRDSALTTDDQGRFQLEVASNLRPGNSQALNIAKSVVYLGGAASAVIMTFGSGGSAAPVLLPVATKLIGASMALGAAEAVGELQHIHDVGGSFTGGRAINAYINLINVTSSAGGALTGAMPALRASLQALETTTDIASLGSGGQQLAHYWSRMSPGDRAASVAQLAFWGGMFGLNTRRMAGNLDGPGVLARDTAAPNDIAQPREASPPPASTPRETDLSPMDTAGRPRARTDDPSPSPPPAEGSEAIIRDGTPPGDAGQAGPDQSNTEQPSTSRLLSISNNETLNQNRGNYGWDNPNNPNQNAYNNRLELTQAYEHYVVDHIAQGRDSIPLTPETWFRVVNSSYELSSPFDGTLGEFALMDYEDNLFRKVIMPAADHSITPAADPDMVQAHINYLISQTGNPVPLSMGEFHLFVQDFHIKSGRTDLNTGEFALRIFQPPETP